MVDITSNTNFQPTAVVDADGSLQVQNFGGLSSNIPTSPFLNRSTINLGNNNLISNTGAIQSDNDAIEKALNSYDAVKMQLPTFQANVLDTVENYTYNWKLYLAPEAQVLNVDQKPTGPFYIIAQSGVSSNFYIKDVEIESIVGPNPKTRNISSVVFRMTIVEPQGISLIDKWIAAAASLNIKNINICPLMLELSFKGYSPQGQQATTNNLTRTWRVKVNDIKTNMDSGGSEYRLSFTTAEDFSFNRFSAAAIIQQQISFPITTVGKFFDDFGYYLTLQATVKSAHSSIARDEYVFKVNPQMRNWVIGELAQEKNTPSMFIDDSGQRSIVLSTNMTLDRIVDIVLSSTKEGQKMANPSSKNEKLDSQPLAPKISKIAKINGKTEFLAFNKTANDYNKRFTYYINQFATIRTIIDEPNNINQDSRIQYLVQDALKKKYQYIFTGENTDVLRLDLKLDNLWVMSSQYYANSLQRKNNVSSKFINPNDKTSNISTPDDLRDQNKNNPYQFTPIPNSETETILKYTQNSDFTSNLNTNSTPIPKNPTTIDPNLLNIESLDQLTSSNQINVSQLQSAITTLDAQNTANAPVQAPQANSISNIPTLTGTLSRLAPPQVSSLISGLTTNTPNSTNANGILIETLNTSNIQNLNKNAVLSMYRNQIDPQLDSHRVLDNIEETKNLGRSIFGIITNQLYNQSSDLIKIEMEIRGDPYWLGESDYEQFTRLTNNTTEQPSKVGYANFLRGENCLFLTFQTPSTYNDATGLINLQQSDLFAGVYTVITVVSSFADGKFTQRLDCSRDIQTDPKLLSKYINSSNSPSSVSKSNGNLVGLINKII